MTAEAAPWCDRPGRGARSGMMSAMRGDTTHNGSADSEVRGELATSIGVNLLGTDDLDSWRDQALCAQTDPEEFFAEKGGTTKIAKQICGACEVRTQCLSHALANDERYGVWGGLSERERRRLKRSQA